MRHIISDYKRSSARAHWKITDSGTESTLWTVSTEKECFYKVVEILPLASYAQAIKWAATTPLLYPKKRNVFVTRASINLDRDEMTVWHVNGHFYTIQNLTLYKISYRHIVKLIRQEH